MACSTRSVMPPRSTLLGQLDETVRLERLEVVVDLLAGDADPGGERRRPRRATASSPSSRARTGSSATAAAAESSITSTSCMTPPCP